MEMSTVVQTHARLWPRSLFDCVVIGEAGKRPRNFARTELEILTRPGVYVLYRDDIPYYVGKGERLLRRLNSHARRPDGRYNGYWNYFSVFVIEDPGLRDAVESILIAAFPTAANRSEPKIPRTRLPKRAVSILHELREHKITLASINEDEQEEDEETED
jgi:hypothetical protein